MKRALKKRVKAVLKNTPSNDDAPVEQLNDEQPHIVSPKVNRRVGTQAAMIGLAISMGATGLLGTRQSDQAQAAAPVGSQKAASTVPVAPDTEVKFAATKLENQAVASASVPENPVIVEPTAISQLPGLEAKWQVVANGNSVQVPTIETNAKTAAVNTVTKEAPTAKPLGEITPHLNKADRAGGQTGFLAAQPQTKEQQAASVTEGEVNAQLKAQQEFALYRLQEKSNRLRESLAESRSGESKNLSTAGVVQPKIVVGKAPQISASNTLTDQLPTLGNASQASLISRLKQTKVTSAPVPQVATTAAPATTIVASATTTAYEVKPGDTLAAIASKYNTSVSELVKANNLSDPNALQISQTLIIPAAVAQRGIASTSGSLQPNTDASIGNAASVNRDPSVLTNSIPVVVPTPATANNVQTNTAEPEVASTSDEYGMGGDVPVPRAFAEVRQSQKQTQRLASARDNNRLRSLQAEIQRLQAKYRAQQSGNKLVQTDSESNNAVAVPIPVTSPSNFPIAQPVSRTGSVPVSRPKDFAITIPVPAPLAPGYSGQQPIKPQFRTFRNNEPVNPEFLPNQGGQFNPARNSSAIRIATPPARVNASDSLGRMRGTTVSPKSPSQLPPLAAVDQYLPKPIDETTPPPSTSTIAFNWPAKGVLTSGYGWRWGRMHRGIDIANATGTPIYASADGVVEKAGWNKGGYGNLVDIRHPDGSMTRYGHNSRILVQVGQQVTQGQQIAEMGSTGFSTGPHSHFEIHRTGKGAVNPIALLPAERI